MKDSGPTMATGTPLFKLEREPTLMPSEFRERMSAKHKSRKSSGVVRSAPKRSMSVKSNETFTYSSENSYTNDYHEEINNTGESVENSYDPQHLQHPQSPYNDDYDFHDDDNCHHENNNHEELTSTSSHIELNKDMKFMIENAYANSESGRSFGFKTPSSSMQIHDLMVPLDDWGSNKDMIREKKYAVLPSITRTPNSDHTDTSRSNPSSFSEFHINNQLDFGRDKMEQEADFFADFRVNTSHVKATPRQDPLPPIRQGTSDIIKVPSGENYKHSNINTKMKSKSKSKDKHKYT